LIKAAAENGLVVLGIEATGDTLRVITGKPGEPGDSSDLWDVADQKRPV
jgi:hypothetical protein